MIFFSMPSVIFTMTFTFNDLALTYYIILSVYAFVNWIKLRNIRWLTLSGIFAGLAMGTKYSGIICFIILLGFIIIAARRLSLKELSIFSLAALLPVLPWLIKNLIFVGNPVYPFLYEIFGGANWDGFDVQRFTREMSHYGPSLGIWRYLSLPLFITCDWGTGDIPIGPIILLCLPFLFFIKNVDKTIKYLLIFCFLYFLFWTNTSMVIRFLFPCVALLCPVIGYIIVSIQGSTEVKSQKTEDRRHVGADLCVCPDKQEAGFLQIRDSQFEIRDSRRVCSGRQKTDSLRVPNSEYRSPNLAFEIPIFIALILNICNYSGIQNSGVRIQNSSRVSL